MYPIITLVIILQEEGCLVFSVVLNATATDLPNYCSCLCNKALKSSLFGINQCKQAGFQLFCNNSIDILSAIMGSFIKEEAASYLAHCTWKAVQNSGYAVSKYSCSHTIASVCAYKLACHFSTRSRMKAAFIKQFTMKGAEWQLFPAQHIED